jgi:CBS domain-containing protein
MSLAIGNGTPPADLAEGSLFGVRDRLVAANDPGAVSAAGRTLPEAVSELATDELDAVEIGGAVTGIVDALTRRLIALSVRALGDPPVPWAWIALGSAARREQAIFTDQDHAIAFDPRDEPLPVLDDYFRRLAESVTSGLEAAGLPRCKADVVATNQALRRPLDDWLEAFGRWMADPRVESVRQTAILFDHRRVAGSLEVERALGEAIASSSHRASYLLRLANFTLPKGARPPLRLARRIDLKHDGLMQIVGMARILAISDDIREPGTMERLRLASDRGLLSANRAVGLREAFRLLWRMRLDAQVAARSAGDEPNERIRLRGNRIRRRLEEAFEAIKGARIEMLQRWPSSAMIGGERAGPLSPVR